ncbi:MAG TPA: primosomal protein N' [Candidatus Saccharimonadales bacterium]|nr:primosomal protein N' [Candidatus Saccharimonadales bacterium]
MRYYEVFVADSRYRRDEPLTYSYEERLAPGHVVTVTLRNRVVTGFVLKEVDRPDFATKQIKTTLSSRLLPEHCLQLANWLKDYYKSSLGETLRLFAPSAPVVRAFVLDEKQLIDQNIELELHLEQPLTNDQKKTLTDISKSKTTTVLLHGDTGTGKTRVYLDLARQALDSGRSVLMLTPEIALTSQLEHIFASQLTYPIYVLHSQLTPSKRKKIWLAILESAKPVVVIGPRSALFSPIRHPGLIILDEAHEPSYKQGQSPRYHAGRVASQLGALTGAKVVLGTATPSVTDYYLALQHKAISRMTQPAITSSFSQPEVHAVDIKDRANFRKDPYLSKQLIDATRSTLSAKKQVMIYLNRRGSARLILCNECGWQSLCPNCDIPLVYHGDEHITRCHICGYKTPPPVACPKCNNPDIIYKSIGTKALIESVAKLFPEYRVQRFDSDNVSGERIHELYHRLRQGEIDILVGTQLLAKGFDLPKLGLVGIVAAETSMALPDYTSEERSFQLLYQVMGRVGRGHGRGQVVIQTYDPDNPVVRAAIDRDYQRFYQHSLKQRQDFRFPPFSYLLKLVCRRATNSGAQEAAAKLAKELVAQKLPVEIVGPTPSFYGRRGRYYYWQLVVKSKQRDHLLKLAEQVPANWVVDLDPIDLL